MKYAIEMLHLTKKIDNKGLFGFLCQNDTGNSTTIKILTCLISPTGGTANGREC